MIASYASLSLIVAAQAPSGGGSFTPFLLQIGAIFAIFYFLVMRPQQKQRKLHQQSLRELKKGDEIVTAGGIVAEVIHIKESLKDGAPVITMEDRITIKSGESRIVVERGRIARVVNSTAGGGSAT
ncbi:MAG TPA: preprotein translocase subunit YajC [Gemmatimonadaceae bacterium]|jgi:preprotein translocase, YajC subunit